MAPLTPAERRLRRELKRRRIRRRRVALAIAIAFLCALAGFALSVAGAKDVGAADSTTSTTSTDAATTTETQTTTTTTTETTTQPATTTTTTTPKPKPKPKPKPVRGRLGSGRAVTLAFGGDVHFEGVVRTKLFADPTSVFAAIAPVFERADLAMVNLETAVTERGEPAPNKEYRFRAPASAFAALKAGGVDVATIANNHGMDYGETGLRDTLASARRSGFPLVGGGLNDSQAYAPYRVTIKGQRIAILGATQVIEPHLVWAWTAGPGKLGLASAYDVARLTGAVRKARKSADTVVVYLHFGVERAGCPSSMQTSIVSSLIGAGADIVVGSHAHQLQGAGRSGKALVDYGLGNFVWYSRMSVASITTGVLKVSVTGRRVNSYSLVPATISGGSPVPLGGAKRAKAIAAWKALRGCTGLQP
jgi:poly-gamma-glutamate synthesis protein (capsule biosynthesis protein)